MRFESPIAFLLLLIIPVLCWLQFRRRAGTIRFSSTAHAARSGRSLRQRLLFVPFLMRMLVLLLLIVCLARPQRGTERIRDVSKGVAIQMVVDRSGSMAAEMEYEGHRLDRLEVVKRVFSQFVMGDGKGLPGRSNDLVGMIAFARYADTVCPLTLGHGALLHFLDKVSIVRRRSEDGTAIGDALALAAARLKTAEETLAQQTGKDASRYEIKSKVIILLTDGEENYGKYKMHEAAKLAAAWGIRIHAVGVGGAESITTMRTPFGEFKVPGRGEVDQEALKRVAEMTGGLFRMAEDGESLHDLYKEIDRLERSDIESVRHMDYREIFTPIAVLAMVLLMLEAGLRCTLFRRIP